MTTICCVWVRGHVPYSVQYVLRLASMTARYMDRSYRFVCLTDQPHVLPPAIRTIQIRRALTCKGWWRKLELFNPDHVKLQQGRVLYLDLDTLIVAPLAPILDYPAPFALVPDAGHFKGAENRQVVKRFNSSVMVWDGGSQSRLFTEWDEWVPERLWGDQDWIGEQAPTSAMMPLEWFPRLSQVQGPPFGAAKVILAKTPKNEQAAHRYPWFREAWQ